MKIRLVLTIFLAVAAAAPAASQQYPAKPIRFIVPFAPGGSSDIQARVIGQKLTEAWGQPVIVENRASGGGIVGAEIAAHAVPDGHTLFLGHVGTQAANPSLYARLPYDPARDFIPVIQTITQPLVLVVPPTSKMDTVSDLIASARREPGKLLYASAGNGSPNHIAGEMFRAMAKLDLVHVPYKGSAPAEIDLMAGRVTVFFDTMLSAMPFIRDGRLRALAVTSSQRSATLPRVPTVAESSLPQYELMTWNGFFVPAGTPQPIVAKLNGEIARILSLADTRRRLATDGAEIAAGSPEAFASYVRRERDKLAAVIRSAGIRIE
ncbi:MAG TPA: tripartite tricarboxylate transporter substrate binding protein [Burkholderiales bacterium]|nr:tripartite tricarboxylate transporter substrate binding protein [Burkholderiales bacterium]